MTMTWVQLIGLGVNLSICFIIGCRVDKMMKGVTQPLIFVQHCLLATSAFCASIVEFTHWAELSSACLGLGVIAFFTVSAKRWRFGAPVDTSMDADIGR